MVERETKGIIIGHKGCTKVGMDARADLKILRQIHIELYESKKKLEKTA
jgi:GTPase Era involved in 16S rRNA processing